MQWDELQGKTSDELKELLASLRHELRELSFKAHSRQLKQVHQIKEVKQTIARLQTLLTNAK
jgi:ribosomal protein L29